MGAVGGIVMPFQSGPLEPLFRWHIHVIGSLIAYEVLMAFFLQAAFLGVLLFGRKLVPQWVSAMSGVMVAVSTHCIRIPRSGGRQM
jgi:cytochrome bd ubiquinol oxidase subunit I